MTTTANILPNRPAPPDAPAGGPLVVVLAYDGLCTFEFGIAAEVFGLPRPEMGPDWYRYAVAAVEPGPLRAAGGLKVDVAHGLEMLEAAHTIVVPGWRGIETPVPAHLRAALSIAHARGARVLSLCSGIAVLAAAGLLDGRRATTHWRYAAAFADRYPAISLDPDVLYVDEGTVLTAAGSAAGVDLCLHLVRRDFGVEAANRVARRLVVPPHREGGQAQYVEAPVPRPREGARLGALLDHLRAHLADRHDLAGMAARAGMSARTFQRRFEAATGETPGAWLLSERLRHARRLLEGSPALPLDDVAAACGFASATLLRHHFRRRFGTSPTAYRRRFSAA